MTFYERAWKERVRNEDKATLEHTVAMREELRQKGKGTPSVNGTESAFSISTIGAVKPPLGARSSAAGTAAAGPTIDSLAYYSKNHVSASIGTSIRATEGTADADRHSALSAAPSAHTTSTARRTQLSHRSPSTHVSGLTEMNTRIAQLETTLSKEREGREAVHKELQEIKALLLAQQGLRGKP